MKIEDSFYIGYITKTKGLKGEVQLFFEFSDYEDLELDSFFIELNGKLVPFFVDKTGQNASRLPKENGLFLFGRQNDGYNPNGEMPDF